MPKSKNKTDVYRCCFCGKDHSCDEYSSKPDECQACGHDLKFPRIKMPNAYSSSEG